MSHLSRLNYCLAANVLLMVPRPPAAVVASFTMDRRGCLHGVPPGRAIQGEVTLQPAFVAPHVALTHLDSDRVILTALGLRLLLIAPLLVLLFQLQEVQQLSPAIPVVVMFILDKVASHLHRQH